MTLLLFRDEKSKEDSKLYQDTEGNEHMGGEIKLGKMQIELEKNQVTGARRKKMNRRRCRRRRMFNQV